MRPTRVPTSRIIPPSTPSASARFTKSSSISVGYSRARESMNASISSGVANSGDSMRVEWVRRERKPMSLEQLVDFLQQQVVFDHVFHFLPERHDVVVKRNSSQTRMQQGRSPLHMGMHAAADDHGRHGE